MYIEHISKMGIVKEDKEIKPSLIKNPFAKEFKWIVIDNKDYNYKG